MTKSESTEFCLNSIVALFSNKERESVAPVKVILPPAATIVLFAEYVDVKLVFPEVLTINCHLKISTCVKEPKTPATRFVVGPVFMMIP